MESRLRKRKHADDRPQPDTQRAAKKTKTRSEAELEAWASWTYPPEFWDRLSKLSLTHEAVDELNRRTRSQKSRRALPLSGSRKRPEHLAETFPAGDLARFARQGGPDLSDIRGHPEIHRPPSGAMGSSRSSRSRAPQSTDPASTRPTTTTKTTKTKKSTPYNLDFDLHLTDHNIHAVYSSKKPDLTETRQALAVARPSLSPSQFSEGAFEAYQEANARAKDEDDVVANVMPTILGPPQYTHPVARNTVFRNLDPLTDGTIAAPAPDMYYGAHPEELARPVRSQLAHHIMPSPMQDKPWAPNFFVEVKGPEGVPAVATRQARHDGAAGTRAMHSLQNYGREEPQYDGQAYTYSSTYEDGLLKLYAHHPTAATGDGEWPEYHMTQMRTFAMTDTRETFLTGATAFRNARDLAKRHRDRFIQAANARASAPQETTLAEGGPAADSLQWQDGNNELQQAIPEGGAYGFEDGGEASAVPQYISTEGGSDHHSHDSMAHAGDPALGGASSFTSSLNSAKHPRQSTSPPSHAKGSRSSKGQKRFRKRHPAEPTSGNVAEPGPSDL